jgi:hypothetical protein
MYTKIIRICLACLAVLLLGGGGSCAFYASSGGSGSDDEEQRSNLIIIVRDGQLIDAPVEGVRFDSGALSGITGPNGEFRFEDGGDIRFSIGDIVLGETVPAKALMSPLDLVTNGTIKSPAVVNIARLLQSLDAIPGDNRISIPGTVRTGAVGSNRQITSQLRYLDFSDDAMFANNASQLVATLTANYPFTAVLVDAATARRHLQATLAEWGMTVR